MNGAAVNHVLQKSINHGVLFRNTDDYAYFKTLIGRFSDKHDVDIYNYCLMPDHVHLLVMVQDQVKLSKFVQSMSLSYSAYFRRRYDYSGPLWQGRFRNFPVRGEAYMLECARYIERSPIRHSPGQSGAHRDYPWSSFSFYANGDRDNLITANPAFERMGSSPEERKSRYMEYIVSPRPYEEILDDIFRI